MNRGGLHHVALTVTDLDRSVAWYRAVFDLDIQLEERNDRRRATILRHREHPLVIGLVAHADTSDTFDPTVTGLDHVAVTAGTRQEIERWAAHLDELGIEHSAWIHRPASVTSCQPGDLAGGCRLGPSQRWWGALKQGSWVVGLSALVVVCGAPGRERGLSPGRVAVLVGRRARR